ncbi:Protein N-acetyltransferase, RimJ/RimL family [Carnobacterium iners]|nr:Protein N-acetyltransferase, RimJ/RimL family [Carnobacterium iners]
MDKTIPYAEIWMIRLLELPVIEQHLPEGFHFAFYQEDDEVEWAAIETAVSEFEDTVQALDYFEEKFAPHLKELQKRMVFVINSSGEKIGTCSAWWKETPNKERYPLIHWVAVKPSYQGKGIAKAMMTHTLKLLQSLEHTSPVYLHTQTWSHIAIRLYEYFGFEISSKNLDGSPNLDYEKTLLILAELKNQNNS